MRNDGRSDDRYGSVCLPWIIIITATISSEDAHEELFVVYGHVSFVCLSSPVSCNIVTVMSTALTINFIRTRSKGGSCFRIYVVDNSGSIQIGKPIKK